MMARSIWAFAVQVACFGSSSARAIDSEECRIAGASQCVSNLEAEDQNDETNLLQGQIALHSKEHSFFSKEAVIVGTRVVDECVGKKILAILRSAGTHRDVWVMYDPKYTNDPNVMPILLKEGLQVAEQVTGPFLNGWLSFQTNRSGASKVSEINWVSQSPYEHAWLVEDDMSFTGPWSDLFDSVGQGDLAGVFWDNPHENAKDKWRECRVTNTQQCNQASQSIHGALQRISKRYAQKLAKSLSDPHGSFGHHEMLFSAFCHQSDWCKKAPIPERKVGVFVNGNWGNYFCNTSNCDNCTTLGLLRLHQLEYPGSSARPGRNQIFHPVKCQLDRCGSPVEGDLSLAVSRMGGSEHDIERMLELQSREPLSFSESAALPTNP